MPLDLVVPHLLLPPDAPQPLRKLRLPAIERWLARADIATDASAGSHGWIAARYGLEPPIAYAAIALEGEGEAAGDGDWMRADPVHLRVDNDDAVLHDAAALGLERAEADALVESLQAHFARDGLELRAPSPHRWYVRVPEGELARTVALEAAVGRNVFGMLPEGGGKIRWRAALTEAQMVMSVHEVNERRAIGANSVWFWGEGRRPAALPAPYRNVFADDVFARGLARISGATPHALPPRIDDVLQASREGATLVVIDALTTALRGPDPAAWLERAAALDGDWFAGLPRDARVVLPGDNYTRVASHPPAARWRFFRGPKPLSAHA